MALPAIRTDILSSAGFEQQNFDTTERQELSRQASGVSIGKNLGPDLWFCEYGTNLQNFASAVTFEAKLRSLAGVTKPFSAHDLRRPYPLAHADGSFNDTGVVHTIGVDNKSLRIDGLDAGFQLSIGDYLAFDFDFEPGYSSRALHQVMEAATANGAGLTPVFEVYPHIRPGLVVSTPVVLKKPSALFTLEPNSRQSRLDGVLHSRISFRAIQHI